MSQIEALKNKVKELEYLKNEKKLLRIGLDMLNKNQSVNEYGEKQVYRWVPETDKELRLTVTLSISRYMVDCELAPFQAIQYRMIGLSQNYIKEKMKQEIEAIDTKINKILGKKWWEFWK